MCGNKDCPEEEAMVCKGLDGVREIEKGLTASGYAYDVTVKLPDGREMQRWTNTTRGHAYLVIYDWDAELVEFFSSAGVADMDQEALNGD